VAASSPPGGQGEHARFSAACSLFLRAVGLARRSQSRFPSLEVGRHVQGRNIMDQSKLKVCYVITQRGEKKYWNRVGVAFLNSDGSINVKLESLPVAGDFQIRDYVPRDEVAGTTLRGRNGHTDEDAYAA
jgi:hypothetical protein